jgi:hypothetical protein
MRQVGCESCLYSGPVLPKRRGDTQPSHFCQFHKAVVGRSAIQFCDAWCNPVQKVAVSSTTATKSTNADKTAF